MNQSDREALVGQLVAMKARAERAESRLVTAIELLEQWLARWPHDAILTARSRAFLAAQPAAALPLKPEHCDDPHCETHRPPLCRDCGHWHWRGQCNYPSAQPAVPAIYHMVGCDARDGLMCTHECSTHRYGAKEPR